MIYASNVAVRKEKESQKNIIVVENSINSAQHLLVLAALSFASTKFVQTILR